MCCSRATCQILIFSSHSWRAMYSTLLPLSLHYNSQVELFKFWQVIWLHDESMWLFNQLRVDSTMAYYPFSSFNVFSNVTLVRSLHNPLRLGIVDESWWVPSSCQLMKTSPIKEVAVFFGPFWIFFWLQASDLAQSVKTRGSLNHVSSLACCILNGCIKAMIF